jgi:hypothetical protein
MTMGARVTHENLRYLHMAMQRPKAWIVKFDPDDSPGALPHLFSKKEEKGEDVYQTESKYIYIYIYIHIYRKTINYYPRKMNFVQIGRVEIPAACLCAMEFEGFVFWGPWWHCRHIPNTNPSTCPDCPARKEQNKSSHSAILVVVVVVG